VDGWLKFGSNEKQLSDGTIKYRYFDPTNTPAPDQNYAFQTLAVNLRGFRQNAANGNNAFVFNSEIRVPVFSTFLNQPINNAFLRNLQVVQFVDLGTAWNGQYNKIQRPSIPYGSGTVVVRLRAGGIGPFAGGYGFGARSTLLGYFIRFDAAWQMNGFFRGGPQTYIALGFDF
jgi:outer membrane protein assembly factor BamA